MDSERDERTILKYLRVRGVGDDLTVEASRHPPCEDGDVGLELLQLCRRRVVDAVLACGVFGHDVTDLDEPVVGNGSTATGIDASLIDQTHLPHQCVDTVPVAARGYRDGVATGVLTSEVRDAVLVDVDREGRTDLKEAGLVEHEVWTLRHTPGLVDVGRQRGAALQHEPKFGLRRDPRTTRNLARLRVNLPGNAIHKDDKVGGRRTPVAVDVGARTVEPQALEAGGVETGGRPVVASVHDIPLDGKERPVFRTGRGPNCMNLVYIYTWFINYVNLWESHKG